MKIRKSGDGLHWFDRSSGLNLLLDEVKFPLHEPHDQCVTQSVTYEHRLRSLMSLIAGCKANHVEPWAWLRDVLTQLARGAAPEQLLPDIWLKQNRQHRWNIADRRKQERQAKLKDL